MNSVKEDVWSQEFKIRLSVGPGKYNGYVSFSRRLRAVTPIKDANYRGLLEYLFGEIRLEDTK